MRFREDGKIVLEIEDASFLDALAGWLERHPQEVAPRACAGERARPVEERPRRAT